MSRYPEWIVRFYVSVIMILTSPLFSGVASISLCESSYYEAHPRLESYLTNFSSELNVFQCMSLAREFIAMHISPTNPKVDMSGFGAARSIVEQLLLWAWMIKGKAVELISKDEFTNFLEFCSSPPADWVGDVPRRRFFWLAEVGYVASPAWRPFCTPTNKTGMRSMSTFRLTLTYCTSFYDFLIHKGVCQVNPARHFEKIFIKGLSAETRSIDRGLTVWHVDQILRVGTNLDCGKHERALFIVAMVRYLLIAIKSIVASSGKNNSLSFFMYTTCGVQYFVDGLRGVQVVTASEIFVSYLERYRLSRGLPRRTPEDENEPLLVTLKGRPGLTQRQIRNLVHDLILITIRQLEIEGVDQQAMAPLKASCLNSIRVASVSGSLHEDGVYKTQEKLGTEIFSSILRQGIQHEC